jgi:hypothetical protein
VEGPLTIILPLLFAFLLLRAITQTDHVPINSVSSRGRGSHWTLLVAMCAGLAVLLGAVIALSSGSMEVGGLWGALWLTLAILFLYLTSFELLLPFTRFPRLAKPLYFAGHILLAGGRSGETYSATTFLAALAWSRGGVVSEERRSWLRARLARERAYHGVFGLALGVLDLLDARALEAAGDLSGARRLERRARALLGTVTYMGRALPWTARRLTHELLALLAARDGSWPMLVDKGTFWPMRSHRLLRAWARSTLAEEKVTLLDRAERKLTRDPKLEALYARKGEGIPAKDTLAFASKIYGSVLRHERVGPGALLLMVRLFDVATLPDFEHSTVPIQHRKVLNRKHIHRAPSRSARAAVHPFRALAR